ncbi:MAG TPA: SoxY-related AACIE arm protein [Alphaproteobacteria bacterium]
MTARPARTRPRPAGATRRQVLAGAAGLAAVALLPGAAGGAPESMAAAIAEVAGDSPVTPGGMVLEVPQLSENGNAVPLTVTVDSPMTDADHVASIHVFTEHNPLPNVAHFYLGARAGRAQVSTRIRLAGSQRVVALARLSDGSLRSAEVEVVVALAACIEPA